MAIQINTTLTDPTGGSNFASGSYVIFDTSFIGGTTDIYYNLQVFRSKDDHSGGNKSIRPVEISRLSHSEKVDFSIYSGLTNMDVQVLLQNHIETMVGSGTTSIVM